MKAKRHCRQCVFKEKGTFFTLTACDLKQHFVVETQSEFGHAREDHFELDAAHYFTAQDTAGRTHLQGEQQTQDLSSEFYSEMTVSLFSRSSPAD